MARPADTAAPELPPINPAPVPTWVRLGAIITGLVGFILLVAVPFLPINQTQSSLHWPQNNSLQAVNAPLISVAPESIDATIPVAAADMLREGQDLLYSTVPPESEKALNRGMFVRAGEDGISVTSLDEVILSLNAEQVAALPADATIEISATDEGTTVSIGDESATTEDDVRPQVTGVYTEIDDTAANNAALADAGLAIDVEINSRFTSTPTTVKFAAMVGGLAMVVLALIALGLIDSRDGKRHGVMPAGWTKIRPLDGVVAAVLGFWHIFGSNTSDDGFILTMGRVSEHAGYMANYYRWYGVPESPFGSPYYDLVALLSQVSATSVFMRLPSLVSALVVWFILSREILPRFGPRIDGRRVAHWTAAMMFLAFWLPYNNGLRPEPIVALGVMLTWASFERSIATSRMLPAAVGTIMATLTLGAGPTGLFAVGVFLVSLPSLFNIFSRRVGSLGGGVTGWLAVIAPFLAAGTAIMVAVFGDQSFAAVMESVRVRSEVGPSLPWYAEYVRYTTLFQQSVDGSLTRRFAMFTMLFCLALIVYAFLKDRQVIGASRGPTQRLLLIIGLSMFFLMFTPTKWTHHFGIYAGVAGVVAALGAVVLSQIAMRSPRARTFAAAAVVLLMSISLAGWNAWWYVSSFGIPWWDRTVQYKAVEANTIVLGIGLVILGVGVVQSLKHNYRANRAREAGTFEQFRADSAAKVSRWAGIMSAPIALACAAVVAFSCLSFAKAYISQSPAYSVGQGNLAALSGQTCSLADAALVETNTNDSFLTPVTGQLGDSLVNENEEFAGFGPNNIPESIEPENQNSASVGAIADSSAGGGGGTGAGGGADGASGGSGAASGANPSLGGDLSGADAGSGAGSRSGAAAGSRSGAAAGAAGAETGANGGPVGTKAAAETEGDTSTGGVRGTVGINGSTMHLPFNLDYTRIPVLGSYDENQTGTAQVTTQWFNLPAAKENTPLLVVSAAGNIYHHDVNGVEQEGLDFVLEYGTVGADGTATNTGELEMSDVGATPKWRNLRIPLSSIPDDANAVRLVATDDSLDEEDWIAFTPPRVPELESINERFDSSTPALLDWSTALQFPCQRSFDHYAGVTEIPQYRVLPDASAQTALTDFQSFNGGGAMATAEAVNYSYELPSYLDQDWARDWGSIQKYELRTNSLGQAPVPAEITHEQIIRSGWWKNSEMKVRPEGETS